MSTAEVVLLVGAVVIVGAMVLLAWLFGWASSSLNPLPRDFALSQTERLYELLAGEEFDGAHYLLALRPNRYERRALAEVVGSLVRNVAECRAESVRRVVEAWGLEEVVVERILRRRGRARLAMLELLLLLHPSEESVRRVVRRPFDNHRALFGQLLLVVYASPERVVESLELHPEVLSWEEMGRVVEVLKMHSPLLPDFALGEPMSTNVKLFALRLAAIEGVGDAEVLARSYATDSERELRNSALGVLMELSLFPPLEQTEVGC